MAPPRLPPAGLLALLLAVPFLGCGDRRSVSPDRPSSPVVVTFVPDGADSSSHEPHRRFQPGSLVVRTDLVRPDLSPVVLSSGLRAAGGARPTIDGTRVLFVASAVEGDPYAVWSCRPDGSDRRKVVEHDGDVGGAVDLSSGGTVWSGAVPGGPVVAGTRSAWALFAADPGVLRGRRLTFGAGFDVEPDVLPDGRVAYLSWQPAGAGPDEPAGLVRFTIHPDGTGVAFLPDEVPAADPRALGREASGAAPPGAGPLAVSSAYALEPRPRPQVHLSMVRGSVPHGALLAIDARRGGRGARVRLTALGGPFAGGRHPAGRVLGEAPLAADGSFYVAVPPDVPLLLDLLDADGETVVEGRRPFWVRPNETRGCVACHARHGEEPPNLRPLAVLAEPVPLGVPAPPPVEDR